MTVATPQYRVVRRRLAPPAMEPGARFAKFCREFIKHTKGEWAGKAFVLEDFQQEFMDEALSLGRNGRRRYREVLLGLPRKNGKSTLAASLALYLLAFDDEPGAEVYAAAAAQLQAGIVFNQAKEFVVASPELSSILLPQQYRIAYPDEHAFFRIISSDAPKQHGLNPSATIIDELHAHESGDLYVALMTGGGARRQPLTVSITTAGYDEETILGQIYNRAMALPDIDHRPGLTIARDQSAGFLMYWYGASREADIDDPAVWSQANPAPWLSGGEYLGQQRRAPGLTDNDFRRYHLNMWVDSEQSWLEEGLWEACYDPAVQLDPRLPVGVGVDVGQQSDSSAVVVAQKQAERVIVRSRVWTNPYPAGHTLRASWETPREEVRDHLRDIAAKYPAPATTDEYGRAAVGPSFAYDPWQFAESAQTLAQDGLNMAKFPQTHQFMGPASTTTYERIKGRRLVHDGDPTLSQHVKNATAELTPRGWKVSKPKKSTAKKNDAAVALVMAVAMAELEPPKPRERKASRLPVGF